MRSRRDHHGSDPHARDVRARRPGLRHRIRRRTGGPRRPRGVCVGIREAHQGALLPEGRRPDASLRNQMPRARQRPRLHRAGRRRRLRRRREHGAQRQPVPPPPARSYASTPAKPAAAASSSTPPSTSAASRNTPSIKHGPTGFPRPRPSAATGRRIAVVGGGPSGLTCAYFLALMGHEVDVFEAKKSFGGMMRYGIPAYRFPRERLDEDVRGHTVRRCHQRAPRRVRIDAAAMEKLSKSHDAVYVAIGADEGKKLDIEGADSRGVASAVELLGSIGDGDYPDFTGKRVVVIGGGNVAMDCARTSVRAGAAEVSIVYRRRVEDMTALDEEIESAIAEGVEMIALESPVRIEADEQGRVRALITQPQMIGPVRGGTACTAERKQARTPHRGGHRAGRGRTGRRRGPLRAVRHDGGARKIRSRRHARRRGASTTCSPAATAKRARRRSSAPSPQAKWPPATSTTSSVTTTSSTAASRLPRRAPNNRTPHRPCQHSRATRPREKARFRCRRTRDERRRGRPGMRALFALRFLRLRNPGGRKDPV